MEKTKWLNMMQPQTLQSAVFLLYLGAVFGLFRGFPFLLIAVAGGVGAWAMVNEKKWGWYLAIGTTAFTTLLDLQFFGNFSGIISLMLDILILVLLLHPITRSYAKTWFK